jgi:hypothetical protein
MRQLHFLTLLLFLPNLVSSQDKSQTIIDSLTKELNRAHQIIKYAERGEKRLQYLLTAKEMALRSIDQQDSMYQALMAIQAYKFNRDYDGNYYDIEIYNGLFSALKRFNDPLIKIIPPSVDPRDKELKSKTMTMADKLCSYIKRNMLVDEWNRFASHLAYESTCPVNKSTEKLKK